MCIVCEMNTGRSNDDEASSILDAALSERFADLSVREIYATLLDEGIYLGSISTMYEIRLNFADSRVNADNR